MQSGDLNNAPDRIPTHVHDRLSSDVLDEGPVNGPVVVLLHGFPEGGSHGSGVSEMLHRHGLRTLAPDQRGYSRGARPVASPTGPRLGTVARRAGRADVVRHTPLAEVGCAGAGHRSDIGASARGHSRSSGAPRH
jgi:pimeloyl-ACP methyl ester carboxylesterase